jgi:hypothetical protein
MSEFFICNREAIDIKLTSLVETGISEDGWISFYTDGHTKEQWELTSYHSEYHGGGIPVLKKLPHPSISHLIKIALTSKDVNDVAGASLELCEREKYNNENFREELLEKLQLIEIAELSDLEKGRLKTIIYDSELFDPTNRREIVGKHWKEINQDGEFYKSVSEKAKKILTKIGETQ